MKMHFDAKNFLSNKLQNISNEQDSVWDSVTACTHMGSLKSNFTNLLSNLRHSLKQC